MVKWLASFIQAEIKKIRKSVPNDEGGSADIK